MFFYTRYYSYIACAYQISADNVLLDVSVMQAEIIWPNTHLI